MNVKISTKEKFSVITPVSAALTANMTEDLLKIGANATEECPGIVLNMESVESIEPAAAEALLLLQQQLYANERSLVICELKPSAASALAVALPEETLNIVPTESEAGDMVQMEAIERELLGGLSDE